MISPLADEVAVKSMRSPLNEMFVSVRAIPLLVMRVVDRLKRPVDWLTPLTGSGIAGSYWVTWIFALLVVPLKDDVKKIVILLASSREPMRFVKLAPPLVVTVLSGGRSRIVYAITAPQLRDLTHARDSIRNSSTRRTHIGYAEPAWAGTPAGRH
jgi:hypothetical protein